MGYIGVYNPLILTFYQHFRPGISNSPTTIPWPSWLVPPKLCLRWASVSGVGKPHGDVVSVFIRAWWGRHGQSWASDVCNIWGGIIPIIFFACSTASHFSNWKKKVYGMIWIHTISCFPVLLSTPTSIKIDYEISIAWCEKMQHESTNKYRHLHWSFF